MAKDTKERIRTAVLIHLCDRGPERTEKANRQIKVFSWHFIAVYGEKKRCLI